MKKTSINSKYGFGYFTFCEHPTWLDGSLLSDPKNKDKFDNILFLKKRINGKDYYFKRYTESLFYSITDWGVFPWNTAEENTKRIKALIDYFPQGYAASIHVPVGKYHFAESIVLDGKPFRLSGVNGSKFAEYTSTLIFPEGKTGIYVIRQASNHQEAIVEDLHLRAQGNRSVEWCSGINSNARVRINRCTAENFSHNGFDLWGNLPEGDVSGSYVENCHAVENGHDGFFAGRSDGNAVTFIGCDARDNGRYGFNDDSFLGNTFVSCMAHYNKGGDFFIRDWQNARSQFIGCYSEGGNENPSSFGDKTTVLGGTWGTGFIVNWNREKEDLQRIQHVSYIPKS